MAKSIKDSIREMRDKAQENVPKFFKSTGYGKYLRPGDLKEGTTVLRIAPSHDPVNFPSPFFPSRYTYLEVELPIDELSGWNIKDIIEKKGLQAAFGVEKSGDVLEWESAKLIEKAKQVLGESFKSKVNKRVFIASQHGPEGTVDLVEAYIQWVVDKISGEVQDRDEQSKRLAPIFGARVEGKWKPGINPSTNFVCYGWDWSDEKKPLYKIEIYGGQMNRIIELYDKFDDGEEPITIDPFSDENQGIGLEFTKSKVKNKWEYKIEDVAFRPQKFDTYSAFQKSFALAEAQLNEFKDVETLAAQFGRNSFKAKDFKLQLNALIMFDTKHGYGALENDEFMEKVELIASQFSDTEEEETTTETQEENDARTGADIDKMFAEKEALKRKEAEEKAAEAKKQAIADAKAKEEAEAAKNETKTETKAPVTGSALSSKLDKLRKNLNK